VLHYIYVSTCVALHHMSTLQHMDTTHHMSTLRCITSMCQHICLKLNVFVCVWGGERESERARERGGECVGVKNGLHAANTQAHAQHMLCVFAACRPFFTHVHTHRHTRSICSHTPTHTHTHAQHTHTHTRTNTHTHTDTHTHDRPGARFGRRVILQ